MVDPAIVFEEKDEDGPGTHVLLIGVSAYDHLIGGIQERAELADGMGQLLSPSRSARTLADWFLSEFMNRERPLRSLSLVVSEHEPTPYRHDHASFGPRTPPDATMANVESAVDHWLSRASSDPDNMAIFFFAGHGVSAGDPILFLQDFGRRATDRFAGSVNLNDFVVGMRTQPPGQQLFLIDACRSPERTIAAVAGAHKGLPLVSPAPEGSIRSPLAKQSVHHATSDQSAAYGTLEGISLFTDALLKALRGGAAQSQFGWHVGTGGLEQALGAYVSRAAQSHQVEQIPERSKGQSFRITKPQAIAVPLYVSLDQTAAWIDLEHLEARCDDGPSASWASDPHKPSLEWSCTVPLREHTVAARFRRGTRYLDASERVVIGTPETTHELTIITGATP